MEGNGLSEETSKKVELLGKLQKKATFCTMAMMAYNPSIVGFSRKPASINS